MKCPAFMVFWMFYDCSIAYILWIHVLMNADLGQKPMLTTAPSVPSSYGYGNPSKKIEIPNGRVGVIIGKAGETIKYRQLQSGAKIQVTRDMDADPHSLTREVELTGSAESIAKVEQLIKDVLAEVCFWLTSMITQVFCVSNHGIIYQ